MWDAVAFLDPWTARDLAFYFSTIPPKPANDGDWELAAVGTNRFTKQGCRIKTSYRVPLVTDRMPKGLEKFRGWEACPTYI